MNSSFYFRASPMLLRNDWPNRDEEQISIICERPKQTNWENAQRLPPEPLSDNFFRPARRSPTHPPTPPSFPPPLLAFTNPLGGEVYAKGGSWGVGRQWESIGQERWGREGWLGGWELGTIMFFRIGQTDLLFGTRLFMFIF